MASPKFSREGASIALAKFFNQHIFLVGGENINSVEKYDIDKNKWTDAPSLNVAR